MSELQFKEGGGSCSPMKWEAKWHRWQVVNPFVCVALAPKPTASEQLYPQSHLAQVSIWRLENRVCLQEGVRHACSDSRCARHTASWLEGQECVILDWIVQFEFFCHRSSISMTPCHSRVCVCVNSMHSWYMTKIWPVSTPHHVVLMAASLKLTIMLICAITMNKNM